MPRYETLFLTIPEITQEESKTIEKQLDALIVNSKGSMLSYERWGKYNLAYPVRKYDYGVYYLMRFEIKDEDKGKMIEAVRDFFNIKFTDLVMRHLTVALSPTASLDYKRPESLEETPSRGVDNFIKEHKIPATVGSATSSVDSDSKKEDEMFEEEIDLEEVN